MAQDDDAGQGQLELPGVTQKTGRRRRLGQTAVAPENPVARVVVERVPLHVDQLFDYLIPARMHEAVGPGVRVRVPFGGQVVDGFVVDRVPDSNHEGALAHLKGVYGVAVVPPQLFELAGLVADYYGGALADVLRLAVPSRHARSESPVVAPRPVVAAGWGQDRWQRYVGGSAFVRRVAAGEPVRGVWTALPGVQGNDGVGDSAVPWWVCDVVQAVGGALDGGRRGLVIVPDSRDVDVVVQGFLAAGAQLFDSSEPVASDDDADTVDGASEGAGGVDGGPGLPDAPVLTFLTHDLSQGERYRRYLAACSGRVDIVVGTRSAAFVPLPDVGLTVLWHDADESFQDRHAPYPHAREVVALRSDAQGCALLVGGFGRSLQGQSLVSSGWAAPIVAAREVVRATAPRMVHFGDQDYAADGPSAGRLPPRVWRAIHHASMVGPVLVHVPRAGYVPSLACAACRESAHCPTCRGPLSLGGSGSVPQCGWCGRLAGDWRCGQCGAGRVRAVRIGSDRTAEELGRAFPGVAVRVSGGRAVGGVLARVPARPSIVVATPGAEPVVAGGYVLTVVLDAHVARGSGGLYASVQVFDRWMAAAALTRSRDDQGVVYVVGEGPALPTAALVRWDGGWLAEREFDERVELSLPPAVRVAALTGDQRIVSAMVEKLRHLDELTVLGPVEIDPDHPDIPERLRDTLEPVVRVIVRVPVRRGRVLASELRALLRIASAQRELSLVHVVLDPKELL